MQKKSKILLVFIGALLISSGAFATNGDNLIAVGPISRSMGGVGIAHPFDAIGAVFANPAAMCFGPYCPSSEVNFSGTLFMPKVEAKIESGSSGTVQASSDEKVYAIPAIGLSVPIGSGPSNWRFGLSAYGVTGLGVDYRGTEIDNSTFYAGAFPAAQGEFTQLQIMKFAPAVAYQPTANLSVGLAFHIDYASLDLRSGASFGYGFGIQPGIIYRPTDNLYLGLTYISPQSVDHEKVKDFDPTAGNGLDTLTLEAPQQLGFGAAIELFGSSLILEADVKWINWSDADGYKDFEWEDQWVFAVGAQYEVFPRFFLRAGYNYGESPLKENNNWAATDTKTVQGHTLPQYYYETFRVIGFPAIVEHHLTAGIGYQFTDNLKIDVGFMHAFENTHTEQGTDPLGFPATIESTLSETSVEFGLTWRF